MTGNDARGFVSGFFAGAAVGAMAALLFAPKSGRELREDLAEESGRLRERAYDRARELRSRGEEALEATRRTAEGALSEVKDASRRLKKGVTQKSTTENG